MKQKAVDEARVRLDRLREAISVLDDEEATNEGVKTAWWAFLLSMAGIYAKLEQGAKGHGPSEAWFGRVKHERNSDDLLIYLHQARNSEEHSLEGSTEDHGIRAVPLNKWTTVTDDENGPTISGPEGREIKVKFVPPGFHLMPVRNRGRIYQPPSQHLGRPLTEQTLAVLFYLGEAYVTEMIKNADALPKHT